VKGPIDQYNPYNYDESFAQEYGGYGEGGVLVGMGAGGGGGGMRNPGGPRGPERELKIPTLVRDVPRPLSPPRHRYRAGSYERDLPPPSLMGVGQPVRGGPGGYVCHHKFQFVRRSQLVTHSFLSLSLAHLSRISGCTMTNGFSVKTIAAILKLPKFPFRKT
jgi:hypothetical protein